MLKEVIKRVLMFEKDNLFIILTILTIYIFLLGTKVEASEDNLLTNHSFEKNILGWECKGTFNSSWVSDGYLGKVTHNQEIYDGKGGTILFESKGAKALGTGYLTQTFALTPAGAGKLSFAWKKDWTAVSPAQQEIEVILVTPSGQVSLWKDTARSRENTWKIIENIDLSRHVNIAGTYKLRFRIHLENANNLHAQSRIWIDEVHLSIPTGPDTPREVTATSVDNNNQVVLRWQPNTEQNVIGYNLYRSDSQLGKYDLINDKPITKLSYIDSKLTSGKTVFYKLAAINKNGYESNTTMSIPATPRTGVSPHAKHMTNPETCKTCHATHRGIGANLLNEKDTNQVCFTCHSGGTGSSFNIVGEIGKNTSFHPIQHLSSSNTSNTLTCNECHNPHSADSTRTSVSGMVGSIKGAKGVSLQYGNKVFEEPNSSLTEEPQYEYEVCLRCHSGRKDKSQGLAYRNVAKEFSPKNPSYHAVLGPSKASSLGSYINGWNAQSPMTCADCHGQALNKGAKGPHASSNEKILILPYSNKTSGKTPGDLCLLCHDPAVYGGRSTATFVTSFQNQNGRNWHTEPGDKHDVPCIECHSANPHGFYRERLLAITSDPLPYSRGTKNTSIVFPQDGNWKKNSCGTVKGCH